MRTLGQSDTWRLFPTMCLPQITQMGHIVLQLPSPLHPRLTPPPLLSLSPLALAVFISNPRICE